MSRILYYNADIVGARLSLPDRDARLMRKGKYMRGSATKLEDILFLAVPVQSSFPAHLWDRKTSPMSRIPLPAMLLPSLTFLFSEMCTWRWEERRMKRLKVNLTNELDLGTCCMHWRIGVHTSPSHPNHTRDPGRGKRWAQVKKIFRYSQRR
jgi:hypothetical protein